MVGVYNVKAEAVDYHEDDVVGRSYQVSNSRGSRRVWDILRAGDRRDGVGEVDYVQPVGRRSDEFTGVERCQQSLSIAHVWTLIPLSYCVFGRGLYRSGSR